MSLNVEILFVEHPDQGQVAELVQAYLNETSKRAQPDWGLPSSFETLLALEKKRKIAISPVKGGWIALVESKEVIDFALAKHLSEMFKTKVLALQLSEVVGAAGYAYAANGVMEDSVFSEEERDPLIFIRQLLNKFHIPFDPIIFREAVQMRSEGWVVKEKINAGH